MPIATAVTMLYLLVLTAVMPADGLDQYRLTLLRDTQSAIVNVDRTPTGFDFSDADGVVMARALTVSPLVFNGSSPDGEEKVDLKSYVPTLVAPLAANQSTATYPTADGGTVTVTRKGKVIVVELSAMPGLAATIEPRGQ